MKSKYPKQSLAVFLLLSPAAAFACPDGWWGDPSWENDRGWRQGMPSMRRHHYVMNNGLPEAYRGLDNPLRPIESVMADGQLIYEQNCVACHGAEGKGDGPAAEALQPRPANLRHLGRMSMMANDAYLYWTVAEGGEPAGSDMPAFKETLSVNEIWSVLYYIRRAL